MLLALLRLASLGFVLSGQTVTAQNCAQATVGGIDQFAAVRDVHHPEIFRSIHDHCRNAGWEDQESRAYTECYENTLLTLPPFHLDLAKLSGCQVNEGGTSCNACDRCVMPMKLHVSSLAIEEFVFSSIKDEVHVTVASELYWADPRLWETTVEDISKVWRPHWHVAVHAVNETRETLAMERSDKLEETHTSNEKLVAPVYDVTSDSFDTKTSYISCLSMQMPASCNTQDLSSCGVRERLTQTVVAKMSHTLYDRYPFDKHILRLELSFPDPYTFIPQSASWKMPTPLEVNWGYNSEFVEFENDDGTESMVPISLAKSLELLTVPEFSHDSSVVLEVDRLFVTFSLTRRSSGILQRFGLPMIFLTFVTTLVPTLGMEQFHPRNIVCIIGMLTAVTLNNGAKSSSPAEASQSTWFDNVFLISICFSYGALLENFIVLWLNQLKWKIIRDVLDKFMMYTLPLYYVSALILLSLLQLSSSVGAHIAAAVPLICTAIFSVWVFVHLVVTVRKQRLQVAAEDKAKDPEAVEPLTTAEAHDSLKSDQMQVAAQSPVAATVQVTSTRVMTGGAGVASF